MPELNELVCLNPKMDKVIYYQNRKSETLRSHHCAYAQKHTHDIEKDI